MANKDALPPGPKGLPIVGNTLQFRSDPLHFVREMQQTYGNRAVQRYLRQTEAPRDTAQPAAPVQTQQAVAPARPPVQTQQAFAPPVQTRQAVAPLVAWQAPRMAPVQRGFFGKVWGGIEVE